MFYYINTFFVYSILGFLIETISFLITGNSGSSGILYGPWTPVYGIGVIIIILVTKYIFKNFKLNRFIKIVLVFLTVTILLSLIEWLGGILIEFFFHQVFWDYSNHKYHIGKYIALDMSLIWGIMSVLFIYCINPWMDKLVKKIPYFVTCILITGFIVDIILTLIFKLY